MQSTRRFDLINGTCKERTICDKLCMHGCRKRQRSTLSHRGLECCIWPKANTSQRRCRGNPSIKIGALASKTVQTIVKTDTYLFWLLDIPGACEMKCELDEFHDMLPQPQIHTRHHSQLIRIETTEELDVNCCLGLPGIIVRVNLLRDHTMDWLGRQCTNAFLSL